MCFKQILCTHLLWVYFQERLTTVWILHIVNNPDFAANCNKVFVVSGLLSLLLNSGKDPTAETNI